MLKIGSIRRKLLIIVPVVVALTLISLFMPAQRVSIEGIGTLSFETTVNLSVGSEVAYASPDTERQSPDAILAITRLTPNDVTYIQDDPDTPDANWLVATANTQNTDVRVSFPTPTGNPTVGADLQEFRALVRRYSQTQTGVPQARIELRENGALIRAGADVDVPLGTFIVSFTWNANEIGTANGSLVECKVVGTKVTGASGVRNTVDVGAVEWNVDYTPPLPPSEVWVPTATGTGAASFSSDVGQIEDLTAVDEATLPPEGKPNLVFPHGFFSFTITGLTDGQTVIVTITLPNDVPVGTQYWKYHAPEGGWIQIPMGDDDGDNVITVTLVDGELGDDDGIADGVIVDQGGPGSPPPPPPPRAVGGTVYPVNKISILLPWLGLALILILALGGGTLALKRRRIQ